MKKKGKITFRIRGNLLKLMRTVKFMVMFVLLSSLQLQAKVGAQPLSIRMGNATFREVAKEIERQTGLTFLYSDLKINQLKNLQLNFANADVETVLEKCLENSGLSFQRVENTIVIVPAKKQVLPQKNVVKGQVSDRNGSPLPGVTVLIKGTQTGTSTDTDGNFVLELGGIKDLVLVFSFVGMKKKEVKVKDQQNLKVVLEEAVETIQEVVVTGIFERKKESFTGSATTYSAEDLRKVGNQNVIQSLKSLDPAFAVLENNDFGSDPNRLPDLEIRGKSSVVGLKEQFSIDPNQPLFILDGFESDLRTIMDLDMERVASVTILKDAASTAIYGSKAANGVVVVETKQPARGQLRVTYTGNFEVSMPDLTSYNLMNAEEKLRFELLAGRYELERDDWTAQKEAEMEALYNKRLTEVKKGVDTYWLAEPLRMGFNHRHSLYAEGGDEYMRYGLGVNYNGIQGVMKESERKIFGANLDLLYRRKKFLFSNKLSVNYNNTKDPLVAFSAYARANPYYKKRNEAGNVEKWLEESVFGNAMNPLWNAALNSRKWGRSFGVTENFSAEYNPVSLLKLRARFGVTKMIRETDHFTSPENTIFDNEISQKKGKLVYGNAKSLQYEGDFTAIFGNVFAEKHRVNLVAGANFSSQEAVNNGYAVEGFPKGDYDTPAFSKGFPENGKADYSESTARAVNFYTNGGYAYDERYLLDLTYRLSGSSVFGSNKRYTNTWAVGFAWNLHNESFIRQQAGWINLLKVRTSVGNPGNQNFSAYQTITSYVFRTNHMSFFDQGVILHALGNPDLEWQTTIDWNIGTDIAVWGNRVTLNLDYFKKQTDPLLVNIGVPASLGVETMMTNMGRQVSRGWNGTVTVSPVYRPQQRIVWSLKGNFRTEHSGYDKIGNKLDKFNQNESNTSLTRYFDGADPDGLYAVRSAGIDPATGQEIFIRKNGTYTYDFDYRDEVKVGIGRPKVEGIFGTSLSYQGFSCNIDFRYRWGGQRFNTALFNKVENITRAGLNENQDKRALYDRWQKPGDHSAYKKISLNTPTEMSSRFVEDDNSIALESVRVGYEFDTGWLHRIKLRSLRVNAYMSDIFRISSIQTERGIEYPFARSVSFSVSAAF